MYVCACILFNGVLFHSRTLAFNQGDVSRNMTVRLMFDGSATGVQFMASLCSYLRWSRYENIPHYIEDAETKVLTEDAFIKWARKLDKEKRRLPMAMNDNPIAIEDVPLKNVMKRMTMRAETPKVPSIGKLYANTLRLDSSSSSSDSSTCK